MVSAVEKHPMTYPTAEIERAMQNPTRPEERGVAIRALTVLGHSVQIETSHKITFVKPDSDTPAFRSNRIKVPEPMGV